MSLSQRISMITWLQQNCDNVSTSSEVTKQNRILFHHTVLSLQPIYDKISPLKDSMATSSSVNVTTSSVVLVHVKNQRTGKVFIIEARFVIWAAGRLAACLPHYNPRNDVVGVNVDNVFGVTGDDLVRVNDGSLPMEFPKTFRRFEVCFDL